jgi:hypothetical protein
MVMYRQASKGPQSFGYTIGTQYYRGSGSGIGMPVGGRKQFAQGSGPVGTMNGMGWTPDIGYLFVLIIIEMFVFGWLSRRI